MMTLSKEAAVAAATRLKLRFYLPKGQVSTEDLWDLSLKDLDRMAVACLEASKPRTSFLDSPGQARQSKEDTDNALRLEVLKYVIDVRQQEAAEKKTREAKAAQREFLKQLLDRKKAAQMEELSAEEIEARLAALGND